MAVKKSGKKNLAKKEVKKSAKVKKQKVEEEEDENEGGTSLDDAFGDDDDVEYAESKPAKIKKKGVDEEELDEELDEIERKNGDLSVEQDAVEIKASKPVKSIKKGDKIKVDGKEYEVDQHYVLIDHGTTKEMAIEIFDSQDKDYQLRYFDDQVETTMTFYELQEIIFVKKRLSKVEW